MLTLADDEAPYWSGCNLDSLKGCTVDQFAALRYIYDDMVILFVLCPPCTVKTMQTASVLRNQMYAGLLTTCRVHSIVTVVRLLLC